MKFVNHQTTLHLSFKIKCCVDRLRPPSLTGQSSIMVASAKSIDRVFHRSSCGWVANVRADDEITFANAADAIRQHYQTLHLLPSQIIDRVSAECRVVIHRGAPKGNRNVFKHGRYTAEAVARRRENAALIRALLAPWRQASVRSMALFFESCNLERSYRK